MNKELLLQTLDVIRRAEPGEACELNTQQAGVLATFLKARRDQPNLTPEERALHSKIATRLNAWQQRTSPEKVPGANGSKERRDQTVLRRPLDKIEETSWDELTADDLRLLRGTQQTLAIRYGSGAYECKRLLNLLDAALKKCREHKDKIAPEVYAVLTAEDNAVASIFNTVAPVDTPRSASSYADGQRVEPGDGYWEGKRKQIGTLQGIRVDLNVNSFTFEGNTTIVGDIPDDALVIVKDGNLTVQGFVGGHVMAKGDLHVEGNIQGGWVISTDGNVFIERVLASSRVVSMRGDVTCELLEGPECIFAYRVLRINGDVHRGRIFGARVQIDGEVTSAEVHTCGDITAGAFRVGHGTPPLVCLRKKLTCEDYGRKIEKDIRLRQVRLNQLRYEVEMAEQANKYHERLARESYRTALFFLLGGVRSANNALSFQGIQTKAVHLQRLISLAEGMLEFFRSSAQEIADAPLDELREIQEKSLAALADMREDVSLLPPELGELCVAYLKKQCNKLESQFEALSRTKASSRSISTFARSVTKILATWLVDGDVFKKEIVIVSKAFKIPQKTLSRIDRPSEDLEALLEEQLARSRASHEKEEYKRANSPLIRLLTDSAARYRQALIGKTVETQLEIEKLSAEFEALAVEVSGAGQNECRVHADEFEEGVVVSPSPPDSNNGEVTDPRALEVTINLSGGVTFALHDGKIRRRAEPK